EGVQAVPVVTDVATVFVALEDLVALEAFEADVDAAVEKVGDELEEMTANEPVITAMPARPAAPAARRARRAGCGRVRRLTVSGFIRAPFVRSGWTAFVDLMIQPFAQNNLGVR
ncbi:MAG: hypothetical protein QOH64_3403, partial [Acidimicrobiaceae bacterium]